MNHWLDSTVDTYIKLLGKTLHPVVWEVGSRDGRDGFELAHRIYAGNTDQFWGDATVVAFEPNPIQAAIIRSEYPKMKVYEYAASNVTGEAEFIVYKGDEGAIGSSSLNLDWKKGDLEGDIITVKTVELKDYVTGPIDIMKIDVEGYSVEVLEGLGPMLNKIKLLHVETEKWTESNIKLKPFMIAYGFRLVDEQEQYGGMPDQVWLKN